jgi:hypothetical protein
MLYCAEWRIVSMTVTGTSTGAALRVQEERQERQRAIGVSGKNTIKDRTAGT